MAEFVVNTDILRAEADNLQSVQRELNAVAARLMGIQVSSFLRSSSTAALNSRIRDCRTAVSNQASNLWKLSNGLDSVANLYDRTEKNLSEPKTHGGSSDSGSDNPLLDVIRDAFDGIIRPGGWRDRWPHLLILDAISVLGTAGGGYGGSGRGGGGGGGRHLTSSSVHTRGGGYGGNGRGGGGGGGRHIARNGLPGEWSLLSNQTGGSGDLWGIPCSGEAGYSLIGYETDTIAKAKWNLDKGEAGIEYGGEISGHLIKGEASGNIGVLGGKAEASIGNAAVSGKVNATLFEDGKFTPSIGVEAKGEASVLKGKAEGYVGNEDYNAHVKGSGTVLGAEAKAEAKAGVITYKDEKTGETVTTYGAKAEVGAEAYIAEGKVSGGFTFMGIDIDVGVSGKAGGAGVEAGGSITSNGVSGEIGAGLGLGAGVEISIDWSDFDPPTMEEIGQGIQEVGQNIGEGFQAVGEGVQEVGHAIGEGIQNAGEAIGEGLQNAGEAISDFFNW